MTREQFLTRAKIEWRYRRRYRLKLARARIVSVISVLLFVPVLSLWVPVHFHPASFLSGLISLCGIALVYAYAFFWYRRHMRLVRRLGLICPRCHRAVYSELGRVKLNESRCKRCGEEVFELKTV